MKYVMLNHVEPIIFSDGMIHRVFKNIDFRHATSAGFVLINNGEVKTYGKSESLNLEPEPGDEHLIAKLLGLK